MKINSIFNYVKNQLFRLCFLLIFLINIFNAFGQKSKDKHLDDIVYVCQPCGLPCDTVHHASPGTCEVCAMPFFATYAWLKPYENPIENTLDKTVAVLLFPGVEIIDFTGPYEVFEAAGATVFTVAESTDILTAGSSLKIKPDYTFQDMPDADIILIPGGNVRRSDAKILDWIKKQDKNAEKLLSVCNGAFFLSSAGLLDGLNATTTFPLIPRLQALSPKTKVVDDQRYVNNGHIITSAGLSAGIDAALFVVSEYLGVGGAQQIAATLEYDWNYDNGYVRGQLADKYFARVLDVFASFPRKLLKYDGDNNQWQIELEIETPLTVEQLNTLVNTQLTQVNQWKMSKSTPSSSKWTFKSDQENWKGLTTIELQNEKEQIKYISLKVWK